MKDRNSSAKFKTFSNRYGGLMVRISYYTLTSKNVGAALVAAHEDNKIPYYPWAASRVEREGWKTPSLPPRQSVRAVFPHTAFL